MFGRVKSGDGVKEVRAEMEDGGKKSRGQLGNDAGEKAKPLCLFMRRIYPVC